MKLKNYSVKKLKKELVEILAKYLDLDQYQIFFFGSRARGDNFTRADIDIGIEGPKPIPFETIAKIKEEISELPTLYKIDIVDFRQVENDFYKVAKQNIEIIR